MKRKLLFFFISIIVFLGIFPTTGCALNGATIDELQSEIEQLKQKNIELEEEKKERLSYAKEIGDFGDKAWVEYEEMVDIRYELRDLYNSLIMNNFLDGSDTGRVNSMLKQVEQNLEQLYAPPTVVEIKDSLLRQSDLSRSCYGKIMTAWVNVQNQDIHREYIIEASKRLDEIGQISAKNRRDLYNLMLQTDRDLEQK